MRSGWRAAATVNGETAIDGGRGVPPVWLEPEPQAPLARRAGDRAADLVLLGPGSLYTASAAPAVPEIAAP